MTDEGTVERVAAALWKSMVGRPWRQASAVTREAYMRMAETACAAYENEDQAA